MKMVNATISRIKVVSTSQISMSGSDIIFDNTALIRNCSGISSRTAVPQTARARLEYRLNSPNTSQT